jgi:hypothetical protein
MREPVPRQEPVAAPSAPRLGTPSTRTDSIASCAMPPDIVTVLADLWADILLADLERNPPRDLLYNNVIARSMREGRL